MIRPSGQMDVLNYVEERTMKHKRTVRMLATTFASFALVLVCSISAYADGLNHPATEDCNDWPSCVS